MAIFDSILFEGQQADEYKARKEKERKELEHNDQHHRDRTFKTYSINNRFYNNSDKNVESVGKGHKQVEKHIQNSIDKGRKYVDRLNDPNVSEKDLEDAVNNINNSYNNTKHIYSATDAASRHARRHGSKNESTGIFESVQMI